MLRSSRRHCDGSLCGMSAATTLLGSGLLERCRDRLPGRNIPVRAIRKCQCRQPLCPRGESTSQECSRSDPPCRPSGDVPRHSASLRGAGEC
eukprot:1185910-Prorocentrum_minimum.AAC.1